MRVSIEYGGRKFIIDSDGLQNTLYEPVISEQGNPREDVIGYFKSFGNAVKKIIDINVGSSEETVELKHYVDRYEKAVNEIRQLNESEF